MRRFNLSEWAVRHPPLVLFMILALAGAGVMAYLKLGRAEDPSFTIKTAVVSVKWQGATTAELQDQVVDPIEKKLHTLPYFDNLQTYTTPGFASLIINLRDYTPGRQVPELLYQLRKKLDDLRSDLPAGIEGPSVNDEFGDVDSVLYAITAPGADYLQLKQAAEGLRRRLEKVSNAEKIDIYGTQEQRIWVEFSHAKLATLGIPAQAIFDSLARQNAVVPAGVVETGAQRVPVRVTGALDGVRAVAETPVQSGGQVFRLGDIATITRGFEDPPGFLIRQEGAPSVLVGVVVAKGANILTLGHDLDAAVAEYEATIPAGFAITRIADQPHVVEGAVGEFMHSFVEALVIVLAVSFLFLGWRVGIVVATSVPLVLAFVFLMMLAMGMDLHRITLGALIIALGLLVDDAIIAVEIMVVKLEQGWDRARAASFAWTSTAFPMLTGTLVTAAGFLPIGLANSAVGEYAGGIFWVVGIALIGSWFVAVVFTPYLGVRLLPDYAKRRAAQGGKAGGAQHGHDALYDTRLYRGFRRVVAFCVRRRGVVILATLGVFAAGIASFTLVPQQFFPISERPELFLELRLPAGTAIGTTRATTEAAEKLLAGDKDIATYTSYVGQGAPRFWLGLSPQQPDTSFAQIVIVATDVAERDRLKARLERAVADGALTAARVRIDRFNFGPPVGFPVQFRVIGPDPLEVRSIAYRVRDVVRESRDVIDPNLDWNERMPSVTLEVDQDRARALGLTPSDIAQSLQTLLSGVTATTIRDGTERIPVIARAVQAERLGVGDIGDLTITTQNGVAVPVSQVARVKLTSEEPILWRRNRDMAITVRADVRDGVQPPDATMAIWPHLADIRASLPPGYRIEIGGAIEESGKANASIFMLFPVMLVLMLAVLMVQLQSFSRLFLVILTAPLGLIGASLALNLSGRPFGFVALLGLIALAGMIMRNTVILVEQIESDVAEGTHTRREAIVDATIRRARPVVLTALAAILAMIPLTGSAFWGPMAFVIMGGLFVATFLTLLFLPALYAAWFRSSLDGAAAPAQATRSTAVPAGALPAAE
jgi:multidrug efflux pump subunit AcrB